MLAISSKIANRQNLLLANISSCTVNRNKILQQHFEEPFEYQMLELFIPIYHLIQYYNKLIAICVTYLCIKHFPGVTNI